MFFKYFLEFWACVLKEMQSSLLADSWGTRFRLSVTHFSGHWKSLHTCIWHWNRHNNYSLLPNSQQNWSMFPVEKQIPLFTWCSMKTMEYHIQGTKLVLQIMWRNFISPRQHHPRFKHFVTRWWLICSAKAKGVKWRYGVLSKGNHFFK